MLGKENIKEQVADIQEDNVEGLPIGSTIEATDELTNDELMVGVADEVVGKVTLFVKAFVKEFEQKISEYSEEAEPGSNIRKTSKVSATIDSIVNHTIPPSLLRLGFIKGSEFLADYSAEKHRKKAKEVFEVIEYLSFNKGERRKILVEVGLEIFQNFEEQMTKVIGVAWRVEIEKLATDAVSRIINYISASSEKGMLFVSRITKGVVLGESKRKHMLATYSGYQVKDKQGKEVFITSELYRGVGIKKEESGIIKYYQLKEHDCAEKYGYRLPFEWELEEWKEVEQKYVLVNSPKKEEYEHILDEKKKKGLAGNILKEINGEDLVRKKDIEELHEEIKNLQIYHEKEDKSTRQILFNLDHLPQFFIERGHILKILNEKLDIKRQEEMSQMILIHGDYGAGKSELARSYAHSVKSSGNIVWINAKSCSTLSNSFYSLAKELGVPTEGYRSIQKINTGMVGKEQNDVQKKKIESIINSVYEKLQDVESHFIFDNTSEYEEIKKFLPPTGFVCGGKEPYVLITSRNKDWKEEIEKINLNKGFSSAEALMFIEKALEIKDNSHSQIYEMVKLAEVLSYFSLALKGATKCIKEEGISISKYLERFNKAIQQSDPDLLVAQGISKELFTTLKVNFDKIRGEKNIGHQSYNVLNVMGYLYSNQIDIEEVFFKKKSEKDKQLIWRSVNLLHKFSVVELKESIAKIHEGTQKIIRLEQRARGTEEETLREIMASLMNNGFTNISHIISVWSHASKYNKLVNEFIDSIYDGNTILHLLAKDGNEEVIKLILEKVDLNKSSKIVNIVNKEGHTPLSYAVIHGHLEIVKYLMERGADSKGGDSGFTSLHWATVCNQVEIFNYFIDNKYFQFNWINEDGSFLHYAAIYGHLGIVECLVGQGADINRQDKDGMSPLHYTTKYGHLDIINCLVGQGSDINRQDKDDMSPLHYATIYGHLGIVECLVGQGADINRQDKEGMSPLHYAAISGHLSSVEHLVEKGSDVNLQNKKGMSSLHYAAKDGHLDIVKCLIVRGAIVELRNKDGMGPLHFAAIYGHLGSIEHLVRQGACVNLQDNHYMSPLHYAVIYDRLDIIDYLVMQEANVNLWNKDNMTPLHLAIMHNHLGSIEYLVEKGADVNLQDEEGMSFLHYVISNRYLNKNRLHDNATINNHLEILLYLEGVYSASDLKVQSHKRKHKEPAYLNESQKRKLKSMSVTSEANASSIQLFQGSQDTINLPSDISMQLEDFADRMQGYICNKPEEKVDSQSLENSNLQQLVVPISSLNNIAVESANNKGVTFAN